MIDTVANTLAQKLECQEFLSTVAGVARAQKLNVEGKIKTLPAFPNPEKKNGYVWLTPATTETGISYFEVLENQKADEMSGGRGFQYSARLRLIVWLNTAKLSPPDVGAMMAACVSALQGKHDDVPPVSFIRVTPDREAPRSPELFSKYTYDEAETQYLMLPFEYFAFDFQVSYVLKNGCAIPNVVTRDAVC